VFEHAHLILSDGSSHGNGAANRGFGSYHLAILDGHKQTVRLGPGTAISTKALQATVGDSILCPGGSAPSAPHSLLPA